MDKHGSTHIDSFENNHPNRLIDSVENQEAEEKDQVLKRSCFAKQCTKGNQDRLMAKRVTPPVAKAAVKTMKRHLSDGNPKKEDGASVTPPSFTPMGHKRRNRFISTTATMAKSIEMRSSWKSFCENRTTGQTRAEINMRWTASAKSNGRKGRRMCVETRWMKG